MLEVGMKLDKCWTTFKLNKLNSVLSKTESHGIPAVAFTF